MIYGYTKGQETYPLLLQQSRAVTTHQSELDPLQMQSVHIKP